MERNNTTKAHLLPTKIRKVIHFFKAITDIALARVRKMVETLPNMAKNIVGLVYDRVIMDTFTETRSAIKKTPTPCNPLPRVKKVWMIKPINLLNINNLKLQTDYLSMRNRYFTSLKMAVPVWFGQRNNTISFYFLLPLVR